MQKSSNSPCYYSILLGKWYYFDDIPDPRVDRTKQHLLKDILVITILAAIAGTHGWENIKIMDSAPATMVRRIFIVTQWHPQR